MSDLSKIVYLSAAQYETLKTNGTITVGGTTINYSNDDLYLTPDTTVPSGGSSGQFLAKASSTDYDTVWTGLPAAGYNNPGAVAFPGVPANYGINKLDYAGNSVVIIEPATTANITARAERAPITPTNLNHAVKSALTDTNHLTMTSAEQTTAQSVLGVPAADASNLTSTNVSSWKNLLFNNHPFEFVGIFKNNGTTSTSIDLTDYNYIAMYYAVSSEEGDVNLFSSSGLTWNCQMETGAIASRSYAYVFWAKAANGISHISYNSQSNVVTCINSSQGGIYCTALGKPTTISVSSSRGTVSDSSIILFRYKK